MGWIRKWDEEHASDGGEQLHWLQIGKWEFSVWLSWTSLSLGPEVEREFGGGAWADRLHLTFGLGPILLAAVRTWNEPA